MSDLVARLRKPVRVFEGQMRDYPDGRTEGPFHPDMLEAADEIERLQRELADAEIIAEKLFDSEDMMKAEADARRQAFIEAAEIAEDHMPAIQCMSVEPIVSACLDIANDIRAKAEKTQG